MSRLPLPALFFIILTLFSCSKEDVTENKEPFHVSGGTDLHNIDSFSVALTATLENGQSGRWSILSGLVDDKVYFEDDKDPSSTFHGLPGISYQLEWYVTGAGGISRDTIEITFAPLTTFIEDNSPSFYNTRRRLQAKKYDRGLWTIEGDDFHWIWNQNFGGTVIPDEESGHIKFFGYENKSYDLIWTTWYGSVSASDTLHFETTNYHQYEALDRLNVLGNEYYYKLDEQGNVIELNLSGDWNGTVFDKLDSYPSLKGLVHLKRLNLAGDGLTGTLEVVSYYKELEYLNLSGNHITGLPENFGDLKKLDTLILDHMQAGYALQSLPESFGELESLKYLDLSSMGLVRLPESFANLTNLEFLSLESNLIVKLPDEFGNLKKLKTFRGPALHSNLPESFSELESLNFCFFYLRHSIPKLPENFGNLDNLETLWVFGDLHRLPESFTDLAAIKDLEFTGATNLLQELPADLGNLKTLEKLRMHGSFKSLPESIGDLYNLKSLRISGKLESIPASIGKLSQLEYLNLFGMNISEVPEEIGNLHNLEYLYLGNNKLREIPRSLGNLNRLYKLDVSNNELESLPETLANLNGSLYSIYVGGNNLSKEQIDQLKSWLPGAQINNW